MQIVYMGFLADVFNWIFEKILSPILSWLSWLLEVVLGWIFENILAPLLEEVFWPLFNAVVEIILEVLGAIFYGILAELFVLVDSMETAFNIFAGIQDVTYDGYSASLLEVLISMDVVRTAVLSITAISFVLLIMFSIFATVQSTLDFSFEGNRPVSKVLTMAFKGLFRMLMIPTSVLIIIQLSTVVLQSVYSMFNDGDSTLSSMVFVVSSLDAARDPTYNISGVGEDDSTGTPRDDIGISDAKRSPFYLRSSGYDYTDLDDVEKSFMFGSFDYLIGYLGCVFLIVLMGGMLMTFIRRIFEILLLYIISPFFAALMPIDDGEKMRAWEEMFVGKVFSGYGSVIAMQLYLLITPTVMGGSISFGEGTTEADYLIRFIFLLGGAWTVLNAGPTVTQLLSYQAGMAEREAHTAGMGFAKSAGSHAYATAKKGAKAAKNHFDAKKEQNKQNAQNTPGGQGGQGGGNGASKRSAHGLKGMEGKRMGLYTNSAGKTRVGVNMKGLRIGEKADGTKKTRVLGMGTNSRKGADGKRQVSKRVMPTTSFKRGADGKMHAAKTKLPGMEFNRVTGPDGKAGMKMTNFKPLGMERGMNAQTGKMQTNAMRLPMVSMQRDTDGKLKASSVSVAGLKFNRVTSNSIDGAGNKVSSTSMKLTGVSALGLTRLPDASGKMHTISAAGMSKEVRLAEPGEINAGGADSKSAGPAMPSLRAAPRGAGGGGSGSAPAPRATSGGGGGGGGGSAPAPKSSGGGGGSAPAPKATSGGGSAPAPKATSGGGGGSAPPPRASSAPPRGSSGGGSSTPPPRASSAPPSGSSGGSSAPPPRASSAPPRGSSGGGSSTPPPRASSAPPSGSSGGSSSTPPPRASSTPPRSNRGKPSGGGEDGGKPSGGGKPSSK